MSIFIDLIVLFILAICIFLGYKKGLVGVIIRLFSFIIALVLSLVLFKPVANFVIDHTNYYDNIKSYITEIATNEMNKEDSTDKSDNNNLITKFVGSSIEKAVKETKDNVVEFVSDAIARNIISIAVLIILFIIFRIAFIFIKIISSAITELPIIKQFDKSGGIIYGLLEALLIIYIIFTIIALFVKNISLEQAINKSYIGSIFYNNNIILNLLLR